MARSDFLQISPEPKDEELVGGDNKGSIQHPEAMQNMNDFFIIMTNCQNNSVNNKTINTPN